MSRTKLTARDIAQAFRNAEEAFNYSLEKDKDVATDTPTALATISFEIIHNLERSPDPMLHILLLPANRITASRYTALDNVPPEYLTQVLAELMQFMHLAKLSVHYMQPYLGKSFLAIERAEA